MSKILITPATAAATAEMRVGQAAMQAAPAVPVTFFAWGFEGADAIAIEFSPDAGITWVPAVIGGQALTLDADTNIRTIYGPGHYRLNKGVTTGAVGAAVSLVRGV